MAGHLAAPTGAHMNDPALRLLIREKLADGRLPHDSIPRVWGGPGAGEMCDACDEIVSKAQMIMEGISIASEGKGIQFHVRCLHLWDAERQVPGHESSDTGH